MRSGVVPGRPARRGGVVVQQECCMATPGRYTKGSVIGSFDIKRWIKMFLQASKKPRAFRSAVSHFLFAFGGLD